MTACAVMLRLPGCRGKDNRLGTCARFKVQKAAFRVTRHTAHVLPTGKRAKKHACMHVRSLACIHARARAHAQSLKAGETLSINIPSKSKSGAATGAKSGSSLSGGAEPASSKAATSAAAALGQLSLGLLVSHFPRSPKSTSEA